MSFLDAVYQPISLLNSHEVSWW